MKLKTELEYVKSLAIDRPDVILLGDYVGMKIKTLHRHSCGNEWLVTPDSVNKIGRKFCPECGGNKYKPKSEYINELQNKSISLIGEYTGNNKHALHRCDVCLYEWRTKPYNISNRAHGCKYCAPTNPRKTDAEYKLELIQKSIDFVPLELYLGDLIKIAHECLSCFGVCWKSPRKVIGGSQCPLCKPNHHSKLAISWLNSFNNVNIQHAENSVEKRINLSNGKFVKVDGYDPTTNIVYEFLGDKFHGNLNKYNEDYKCHPYIDKTAKELNNEWTERKQLLESLGYTVVHIWEDEWKLSKK